jgi:hypothetical protein
MDVAAKHDVVITSFIRKVIQLCETAVRIRVDLEDFLPVSGIFRIHSAFDRNLRIYPIVKLKNVCVPMV